MVVVPAAATAAAIVPHSFVVVIRLLPLFHRPLLPSVPPVSQGRLSLPVPLPVYDVHPLPLLLLLDDCRHLHVAECECCQQLRDTLVCSSFDVARHWQHSVQSADVVAQSVGGQLMSASSLRT